MATVTDPIMLDSTGQAIKNSIDLLSANINRTASNIPYDNNLTIKGKIDEIDAKTADDIPYSSGVSVKDKIDEINDNINRFEVIYNNVGNQTEVVNIDNNYHTYLVTCYGGGTNMQVAIASFRTANDYMVQNLVGSGVTSDGSKITFAFTNYHIASVIQLA